MTKRRLIILTTTLYVYELDPSQFDEIRSPPYKILVNAHPSHARYRWPRSFPQLRARHSMIKYGFITGHIKDEIHIEYIVFVFDNGKHDKKWCTMALDIVADTIVDGLCDSMFKEYRMGTNSAIMTLSVAYKYKENEQKVCFKPTIYQKSGTTTFQVGCYPFDKCTKLVSLYVSHYLYDPYGSFII